MFSEFLCAVKAAIFYSNARASSERKDYIKAEQQINEARRLLGQRLSKPSLFGFDLRAAEISLKLGKRHDTLMYTQEASKKIKAFRRLDNYNRLYLLDYCAVLEAEASGRGVLIEPMLPVKEHSRVKKEYREDYPLEPET